MRSLRVLITLSRPLGWLLAPLVYLIGLFYSGATLSGVSILQIMLLSFPFCIVLFGINDIYDYGSDKLNPRKNPLDLTDKDFHVIKSSAVVVILGLLLSAVLTKSVFNIAIMVLLIFFSYFYSAPPLRFKERPPLDSVSNGLIFLLVFALGYSLGKPVYDIPLKIYLVGLCVSGIHAYSTVMDYDTDNAVGHKTFSTVYGKRTACLYALLCFLSALFFAKIGRDSINYYFAFCSIIFVVAFIHPTRRVAYFLFRLIFAGFMVTALVFVYPYLRALA